MTEAYVLPEGKNTAGVFSPNKAASSSPTNGRSTGPAAGSAPRRTSPRSRTRARIAIPPALAEPHAPVTADVARIQEMFLSTNPGLTKDAMTVACKKFVSEVRFCLDKDLKFRKCGRDVTDQCRGTSTFPPVR